jgi:hypothetical protein
MMGPASCRRAFTVVIGLTILCVAACTSKAKSPTSPTIVIRSEAGENAVNQAVTSAWRFVHTVYSQGTGGAGPSAAAAASVPAPSAQATALAAAEDVTCANLTVKYYSASGAEQASYNPLTTTRMTARGVCTISGVSATVDLTLDDVQASSSTVVANGTVQGVYQLLPVIAEVKSLRMPKQTCAYPVSGQVVGRAADLTITVEFNGSSTAKATYTRAGSAVTYDVQMSGC